MTRKRNGYSLLEAVIAMAVFSIFLAILFLLTSEMRFYERRLPINFARHPQLIHVLTRLRRDVLDAHGRSPYRNAFESYAASQKVLILEAVAPGGGVQTIVWDFRQEGEVRRRAYNVGNVNEWVARGVPKEFSSLQIEPIRTGTDAAWATRIVAVDSEGRIAIDQILQPRATE